MGRIKLTMVKKAARQILQNKEERVEFSEDFDKNKKLLKGIMPSKPIRNKVAGYISRLIRQSSSA